MAVIVEKEEVDRKSWYLVIFQPYWLVLVKVVDRREVQKVVMGAEEPKQGAGNPSSVYLKLKLLVGKHGC